MLHFTLCHRARILLAAVVLTAAMQAAFPAAASPPTGELAGKIIVVDPGHGGDDPGAVGCHGIVEKDVAMEIGQRVAKIFRQAGARVVLTREGDKGPVPGEKGLKAIQTHDLARRVELANRCGAHLFLSIHLNHFSEADEYGAQVFYQTGSREGQKLAEAIQVELNRDLVDSGRQALAGDFYVCRNSRMPAVIVEVGFLSHEHESRQLTDPGYQERAARAILKGVINYFRGGEGEVKHRD
ncbi:N-acetylmuramoyl-L-alanine amidase [Desulfofundulus thermocisternus]|uniref:N-acetylmuramoyl-L-alanine amidase n=1 Tax=Desulfofundulus thermocisternus TaxID=42471 RepID=UPI0019FC798F|nr:N-acetylmuramoyl-L-alanine amidase [Desulfofundulus thermocisternus]MBE3584644.1 N-acetylmuramoyl-L-alanine amidase [Thermoanaerobacter sp.]